MKVLVRLSAILFLLLSGAAGHCAQIACPINSNPTCLPGFPVEFSGGGIPTDIGNVLYSSPAVAKLGLVSDNSKDIVIGTTGGYVIAYHADGSFLWAYKTGNLPIAGKPAIADIDGDGVLDIVVGAGSTTQPGGGVYVLRRNGTLKCAFTDLDVSRGGYGVFTSPSLAPLDHTRPNEMEIVFSAFDTHIRALHSDCSLWWDKSYNEYVVDTVWSSPAIYDLDHDGQLDVVVGEDSDPYTINGYMLPSGGMLRAFRGNGVGELPGFPVQLNEVIYSSPAIGDIAGDGQPSILVGNGRCWDLATCAPPPFPSHPVTEAMFAWNASGAALAGWPYPMPAQSTRTASPALADLNGDGTLETVINTLIKTSTPSTNDVNGYVHVVRNTGSAYPGWPVQPILAATCSTDVNYGSMTSPIVVDLTGDGALEIVLSVGPEVMVWDRNGNQLSRTHVDACANPNPAVLALKVPGGAFNTPTAADLFGDGHIELIVGSAAAGTNPGALYAWRFANSSATPKNMPWPEFRHDVRNTGAYTRDSIFKNGFE